MYSRTKSTYQLSRWLLASFYLNIINNIWHPRHHQEPVYVVGLRRYPQKGKSIKVMCSLVHRDEFVATTDDMSTVTMRMMMTVTDSKFAPLHLIKKIINIVFMI